MHVEYLFVYGTLRKNVPENKHSLIAQHSEYLGEGVMQGRLYQLDGYPGAIISGCDNDKVYGEVYRLTEAGLALKRLDEYEECSDQFPEPHEYRRKKLPVRFLDGHSIAAWVYVFNHDVTGLEQIQSGHFRRNNRTVS